MFIEIGESLHTEREKQVGRVLPEQWISSGNMQREQQMFHSQRWRKKSVSDPYY